MRSRPWKDIQGYTRTMPVQNLTYDRNCPGTARIRQDNKIQYKSKQHRSSVNRLAIAYKKRGTAIYDIREVE